MKPNQLSTALERVLIEAVRSQVGRAHYRYTSIFNDGSKQTILSRRFFQYAVQMDDDQVIFEKTKPTANASLFVAIKEAPVKHMKKTAKPAAKKPAAKKADKASKKAVKRIDSGYVAAIRDLLVKGKYTISQAAAKIKEQFPDKELHSIKRIAANVAKRARLNPETKNLRWVAGAPPNTGYMARIDVLLRGGKHTTRQIGETVAKEFDKDPVSAKKVVRARLKRLRDNGDKTVKPLLEADIREEKPAKKSKATPKPAKKASKVKVAAKAPKAKGKAKKSAPKVSASVSAPAAEAAPSLGPVVG